MFKLILSALLLLTGLPSVSVNAQDNVQVLDQRDFRGGINTTQSSLAIKDTEAQALANVYLDQKGITTRGGQKKRNPTAIGGGSLDVNGVFEYKKSDGTDYCVAFSSITGYYSTDKCVSFTAFVATITPAHDMNCVPFQDRLYCVNGTDPSFYFNGSDDIEVAAIPVGKYIRAYQNRLWVAGVSGNLSRLYYSDVGDGDSWDTTLQQLDFNPEDGDVVTGIGPAAFEVLPTYKRYSSFVVQGTQADNYTPVIINSNIGARYHRSIKNFLAQSRNIQLFDSLGPKGGLPGIYYFNGIVIDYASGKIEDDLRELPNFRALSRFRQWSTKAEWDTGTTYWTSTTIDVNTISPSSWTATDTSSADFAAGTLIDTSTSVVSGTVTLGWGASTLLDDFTDGDYTNNPTWTVDLGTFDAASGYLTSTASGHGRIRTPITNNGSWQYEIVGTPVAGNGLYILDGTNFSTANGYVLSDCNKFYRMGTGEVLTEIASPGVSLGAYSIKIARDPDGVFNIYCDGVLAATVTDNTYKSFSSLRFHINQNAKIDNMYTQERYRSSGTFISQEFNKYISTPTSGPISYSSTTPSDTDIFFDVRNSTASDGVWTPWIPSSSTLRDGTTLQYMQYRARFSTDTSTKTPQLHHMTLQAASTGTWTAGETFLSADVSATWGLLQADETTVGSAEWAYAMKSSTYAGGTADDSWQSVTNNSAISIATGAYIDIRATNSFPTSTDTAKLNSITIYFNEGAQAYSTVGEIFKGRYYWFGQSDSGTENDICYCLDSNLAWVYLTGIYARSAAIIDGGLYTGDSRTTSSGFIWEQDVGTHDDGVAFTAFWQGKDHLLALDEIVKSPKDLYVTYKGQSSLADLTVQLYGDSTVLDTWTIDTSTGNAFGVKKCHIATTYGVKRAGYFNVKFTDSDLDVAATVLGYRLYWWPVGLMRP